MRDGVATGVVKLVKDIDGAFGAIVNTALEKSAIVASLCKTSSSGIAATVAWLISDLITFKTRVSQDAFEG